MISVDQVGDRQPGKGAGLSRVPAITAQVDKGNKGANSAIRTSWAKKLSSRWRGPALSFERHTFFGHMLCLSFFLRHFF